jgi:hypothetical protein
MVKSIALLLLIVLCSECIRITEDMFIAKPQTSEYDTKSYYIPKCPEVQCQLVTRGKDVYVLHCYEPNNFDIETPLYCVWQECRAINLYRGIQWFPLLTMQEVLVTERSEYQFTKKALKCLLDT